MKCFVLSLGSVYFSLEQTGKKQQQQLNVLFVVLLFSVHLRFFVFGRFSQGLVSLVLSQEAVGCGEEATTLLPSFDLCS